MPWPWRIETIDNEKVIVPKRLIPDKCPTRFRRYSRKWQTYDEPFELIIDDIKKQERTMFGKYYFRFLEEIDGKCFLTSSIHNKRERSRKWII